MSRLLKSNFSKLYKILSLTLLFSCAISSAIAQELDYNNFPTGEQEGGGVRGTTNSCSSPASYPIPLLPKNSQTLTASSSPKLFFDVSNIQKAVTLDFLLLNQDNEVVYQNLIQADNQSGLVSLNVSDNSNTDGLKINSNYHWYLVDNCQDNADPNVVISGSLKRIELNEKIRAKLNSASSEEKITIYQQANIWHEVIENFAQLKCDVTNDKLTNKQLIDISDIVDISKDSFKSSLNTYCTSKLQK